MIRGKSSKIIWLQLLWDSTFDRRFSTFWVVNIWTENKYLVFHLLLLRIRSKSFQMFVCIAACGPWAQAPHEKVGKPGYSNVSGLGLYHPNRRRCSTNSFYYEKAESASSDRLHAKPKSPHRLWAISHTCTELVKGKSQTMCLRTFLNTHLPAATPASRPGGPGRSWAISTLAYCLFCPSYRTDKWGKENSELSYPGNPDELGLEIVNI